MGKWQDILDGAMGAGSRIEGVDGLAKLVWSSADASDGAGVSIELTKEPDGLAISVKLTGRVPRDAHCAVTLSTPAGAPFTVRPLASAFGDGENRLLLMVECGAMSRRAKVYLPYCALDYERPGPATLQITLIGGRRKVIFRENHEIRLPKPELFSRARVARPLVGLCMSVGCADGKLGTAEMHMIEDVLGNAGLNKGQKGALREVMKSEPVGSVEDLSTLALRRFPNVTNPGVFLELMSEIAQAGGVTDEAEVEVIRRTASALGLSEEAWARQMERLKLKPSRAKLWEHYVALGLNAGTSFDDVKKAYRERVAAAARGGKKADD